MQVLTRTRRTQWARGITELISSRGATMCFSTTVVNRLLRPSPSNAQHCQAELPSITPKPMRCKACATSAASFNGLEAATRGTEAGWRPPRAARLVAQGVHPVVLVTIVRPICGNRFANRMGLRTLDETRRVRTEARQGRSAGGV